jgi:four helix bundle protein
MNNEQRTMNNEQRTIKDDPLSEKADELAHLVYKATKKFPKEELYGLTSQLRRAALSVPLNIVEGFARKGSRDYRQFLYIAYGSLKETKYLLNFAFEEGYLKEKEYGDISSLAEEVGKILWSSIKTLERKLSQK